jgi:hypothetical protein
VRNCTTGKKYAEIVKKFCKHIRSTVQACGMKLGWVYFFILVAAVTRSNLCINSSLSVASGHPGKY